MPSRPITLDDLRRHAVARTLFKPTTLPRAIQRLGFVQFDPIRAPARAQDLVLRHRVQGYQVGDLDRRYHRLPIEEDCFVNHGILPRHTQQLMHPREARTVWTKARWKEAHAVLDVVRELGVAHPSEVDAALGSRRATNWFGGTSRVSTQLLDGLQYRGHLRVAGRQGGIRLYALREAHPPAGDPHEAFDRLLDVVVNLYAPLPAASLGHLASLLVAGVPQWRRHRAAALKRAFARLPGAEVNGERWTWPEGEDPRSARHRIDDDLRLLAPFDPIVWDRRRFERLWGWAYRFEAYTPAAKRQLGYYALPMLWRGDVIGWANVSRRPATAKAGVGLQVEVGHAPGRAPKDAASRASFRAALEAEVERLGRCLGVAGEAAAAQP
jgi:uncharacterized protein